MVAPEASAEGVTRLGDAERVNDDSVELAATDEGPMVHVRIALGGARLEFSGRQSFFDQHIASLADAMLGSHAAQRKSPTTEPQAAAHPAGHQPSFVPSSPRKFQRFAGQIGGSAATVDQRIMAFAFYLWNYERRDDFGTDDIVGFFHTAHEEPPEDLEQRVTNLASAKRFLEALAEPGRWRFTSKGVNYVKNRLLDAT